MLSRRTLLFALIYASTAWSINQPETNQDSYRVYDETTAEHVKKFYLLNHTNQTLDFVLKKEQEYLPLNHARMSIWDAIHILDALVDESDPDASLPQHHHLFQTAEALRADGCPRWLILTGFIHDLGKMLTIFGEPQWAVVGDTFPVGCAYSDEIVFSKYFQNNPDINIPLYQTTYGIYSPGCGFDNIHMSWGHDEYLYHVVKKHLPKEASYIIRYHSFYAAHKDRAYDHLMDDNDRAMLPWLQLFQKYDLYSKSPEPLNIQELLPYYQELISEFFPEQIDW